MSGGGLVMKPCAAAAGVGGATPTLRLSAAGLAAGARGPGHEPQEGLPVIPRGAADGPSAWRAQAGLGLTHADDGSGRPQSTLVARLRFRHAGRRPDRK